MPNAITSDRAEKIRTLHDEGLSSLEISGHVQIARDRIERFLNGSSDVGMQGAAPVDEAVADAANAARQAESRARQAGAEGREARSRLEQRGVEEKLLASVGDFRRDSDKELWEKIDRLTKNLSQGELDLLEQGFAATLEKQTEVIERLQARQPGAESELSLALPTLERLASQIVPALQELGDRAGATANRWELQMFSRLPPSGLPTVLTEPVINVSKFFDSLVDSSDQDVFTVAENLLGPEAVRGLDADDLRLRLVEIAQADAEARKPSSVPITQWPASPIPITQITQLLQGFLQQLNLPDFRIGGGQSGAGPQPLTGAAADAERQVPEASVSLLKLRCPSCGEVNSFDLNALRNSKSAFEPCRSCGLLFDLGSHIGGEAGPHLPRYRAS